MYILSTRTIKFRKSGCAFILREVHMSKFNQSATPTVEITTSKDGVVAFKHTTKNELCQRVLSGFFTEEKFYETAAQSGNELVRLIHEVATNDPVFVAKLAVLAREQFNMRSVTQVLVAELAKIHRGDALVSNVISRVVQRPDDMSEILSYWASKYGSAKKNEGRVSYVDKKIPAQIRKGLCDVIRKFDAYQLSKYKAEGKAMKMRDLFTILHPRPATDEQSLLWKSVVDGSIAPADTWETNLSAAGQKAKDTDSDAMDCKREVWEDMITNKKLPYMAALRNIRNVVQAGVSANAHKMLQDYISNEKAVFYSKQLPFRFYSAYKALEKENIDMFLKKDYLKALNRALFYSAKNYPKFKGRTVLAVDLSFSMTMNKISKKSEITCKEIGAVLCALATQFCESSVTFGFADSLAVIDLTDSPDVTLDNVSRIIGTQIGSSTNGYLVTEYLRRKNIKADNIIFFTDEQMNGAHSFKQSVDMYRKEINPDVYVYTLNLNAYGSTQLDPRNKKNVYMAGWSDNVLKYIAEYQELHTGIVDMVDRVQL